jgi:peptidoglycan hydrolase-like protein with peptidoglycan-binding domain
VPLAPARAVTGSAAPGATTAELSGTVLGGGLATRYVFQYGASSALGESTPSVTLPASASAATAGAATAVSVLVSGLRPGTSYLYRLVAANALGSWRGDEATFTTLASSCTADAAAVSADEQALSTAETALADARATAQSQSTTSDGQLQSDELAAQQAEAALSEAQRGAANSATTLTALAAAGTTIRRGGTVYALDGVPVPLFYGTVIPSRALYRGVGDGPDVVQLQSNLIALGFGTGVSVSGHFDDATVSALAAYQHSLGAAPSGMLRLGDVVVAPGPLRVSSLDAVAGQSVQPGVSLLQATSTRRIVSVPLNPNNAPVVTVGEPVSIVLPSNASVAGSIVSIGPPAPGSSSGAQAGESVVTIVPRDVAATGSAAGVPVEVSVTTQMARDVLAMPIGALLALAGGGYGVEIVLPSGRHRLVAVQTGLYSNTEVQVSGGGISAGTRVVVAQ